MTTMRRMTEHEQQLEAMYSIDDGRTRGEGRWKRFPFFWFMLFLSYRCTRRCPYCYAFNQVGDGDPREMDDRTFARLLEWIPEVWRANEIKVNAIGFLGGEPLLRTDRIKKVMEAVFRDTDGMQGFLYTNGDLVDSVDWDDLEDIRWISTNVTDTDIVELSRRMAIVRDRSNVINQTVVATLDDGNLERALDLVRFGLESGYRLRFYRNLYRGLEETYKRRLLTRYHEICDLIEEYIARGYSVHTTFLFDTLIALWDHESSPYLCGKSIATVYPDGTIGPCLRNHTLKTGTLFDDDSVARLQCDTHHYDVALDQLPGECRACDSRKVCQGGCPNDKLVLRGSTCGKSVVCELHQELIPRLRQLDEMQAGRPREEVTPVL